MSTQQVEHSEITNFENTNSEDTDSENTDLFTQPVVLFGRWSAPRWVSMLMILSGVTAGLAWRSHGTPQVVTAVVAAVMMLVLYFVGRPRTRPMAVGAGRES